MKLEYAVIAVMALLVSSVMILIFAELDKMSHITQLEKINQQAIHAQETENHSKLESYRQLMQQKLQTTVSNALEIPITKVYLEEGFNFPFRPASSLPSFDSDKEFLVCDITSNMHSHLQNIRTAELFQMYEKKYSGYEIELFVQDERRYESMVHYGFAATSDDGNSTAIIHFHGNSCSGEILDIDKYLLSCRDKVKDKFMSAHNKEDIHASMNHPDFCTIPLDSWRQSVYDYNQKIKEQLENHLPTIKTSDKSYESVSAYQLESHRLDLLGDISSMYVMGVDDEQDIEEKIRQYNNQFGSLPDELSRLIEQRK